MLWPFQAGSVCGERREKGDILEGDGTKDVQMKAVDFVKEMVDWLGNISVGNTRSSSYVSYAQPLQLETES
jgi:hypothetical protein